MKNKAFHACFMASLLAVGFPASVWAAGRTTRLPHTPFAQSGPASPSTAPTPKPATPTTTQTATPPNRYSDGTGDELVDRLNNAQLNQNYRGPYYYPGQPVPPFQATAPDKLTPATPATSPAVTGPKPTTPQQAPLTPPATQGTPFR